MNAFRAFRLVAWGLGQAVSAALVLLGASFLLFALVRASPGGGVRVLEVVAGAPADTASQGVQAASGRAWPVQYGIWLSGVVRGDFGRSGALQRGRPVAELLAPAAARSLALAGGGLFLSAALALALAWWRQTRSLPSRLGEVAAHLLSNVPVFLYVYGAVVGGNSLLTWGAARGWWSLPGWFPFPARRAWPPWLAAALILAVGDGLILDLYGRFRAELQHAAGGDHLVGVRLLGLSVPMAVFRGFLPGASSHLARRLSVALGSMVVLESALGWPGLGYLAWQAAAERDLPVLLGVALFLAAVVRVAVAAAEAAWYAVDPRRREGW